MPKLVWICSALENITVPCLYLAVLLAAAAPLVSPCPTPQGRPGNPNSTFPTPLDTPQYRITKSSQHLRKGVQAARSTLPPPGLKSRWAPRASVVRGRRKSPGSTNSQRTSAAYDYICFASRKVTSREKHAIGSKSVYLFWSGDLRPHLRETLGTGTHRVPT